MENSFHRKTRGKKAVTIRTAEPYGEPWLARFDRHVGPDRLPESVKRLLPGLKSAETAGIIVTLPEAAPVYEALRLEEDLKRAQIATKWWVINQSLYRSGSINPMLSVKAGNEVGWINKADTHADGNAARIAWSAKEGKGDRLLSL